VRERREERRRRREVLRGVMLRALKKKRERGVREKEKKNRNEI
tara:strand:+ start:434 stop:562 length:129 start_codon:yes stop_codon:yes gene_type:complete